MGTPWYTCPQPSCHTGCTSSRPHATLWQGRWQGRWQGSWPNHCVLQQGSVVARTPWHWQDQPLQGPRPETVHQAVQQVHHHRVGWDQLPQSILKMVFWVWQVEYVHWDQEVDGGPQVPGVCPHRRGGVPDSIKNAPNLLFFTTSNITGAIDLSFVDRSCTCWR